MRGAGARSGRLGGILILAIAGCLAAGAAPASADLASLKAACVTRDADDNDTSNGLQLPYRFCDDGIPAAGGRSANVGAVSAVAVPQRYAGFLGLPDKVAPDPNAGADPNGNIALDIDVSLPDPSVFPPPPGGYPLIAMMHGCCGGNKTGWEAPTVDEGGEKWHYSNAWFASRGYVVLTYTSRGFVNGSGDGSTGEMQLQDRRYEINDLQHLAGQLADDSFFNVGPQKVIATGGSYGGGFSWMALTDPEWESPGGKAMRLAAAAPKYGWTDLVDSLVPTGRHDQDGTTLPAIDGSDNSDPIGFPKTSIVAGLYATGAGLIPNSNHTTFPGSIDQAFLCLQSTDPFELNPLCLSAVNQLLPQLIQHSSAYYQNEFFQRLADGELDPVPVFSASTFTDPLFPPVEDRRMVERLRDAVADYPVQEYYGDYQHFTQNKAKEWGDICGADRHVCRLADYPGGDLNADPTGLERTGITTRLNRFLDHYAAPPGNASQAEPEFDVTASLQICPRNAAGQPEDEPGPTFTADTFDQLTPSTLHVDLPGTQTTLNKAVPNLHAVTSDPVANQLLNGNRCPVETTPAGPGVATYTSGPLDQTVTMIGPTELSLNFSFLGIGGYQLNTRLYDVFPNGDAVMVDRGVRRIGQASGRLNTELHSNGWRFGAGHRIRVEIAQDDFPHVRFSSLPSVGTVRNVSLDIPIREQGVGEPDAADLSVTKSDSPDPVAEGEELTYSLTARNEDGDVAHDVVVTDELSGTVAFSSAGAGCAESGGTVTCDAGDLGEGEERTFTITVIPTRSGQLSNTATVSSETSDPNPDNDSATAETTVTPTPGDCDGGTVGEDDVDDTLVGTNGDDLIRGLGGNDEIRGRKGRDCLAGDEGEDELRGGRGHDRLFGGPDADLIVAGKGLDAVFGGDGDDRIFTVQGHNDTVSCGDGEDFAHAGRHDRVADDCERVRRGR